MDVNCWIITGNRGSGKTSFCKSFIQAAREAGWDAAGILSLAGFNNGIKDSIRVMDIRWGMEKQLASVNRQRESDIKVGKWYFDPRTLEWGNDALLSSVPCVLLVVDELGPLEFNQSQGWIKAWKVLHLACFQLALVVVRPELLDQANAALKPTQCLWIDRVEDVPVYLRNRTRWLDWLKGS
ncbi:MAG: nucleoside-triphosphatase [Anaerolineaceae bacterium]